MESQTKIGIGATALIAIMALLEPHLSATYALPIYLLLGAVALCGFWPLLRGAVDRLKGTRVGTWGPWVLIVGGPVLGFLWQFIRSLPLALPPEAPKAAITIPNENISAPTPPQTTAPRLASPAAPRNKKDVRRIQDSLEEIYEFLSTQDAALQNDLSNLEKFRMSLVTSKGKAHALDTAITDEKNIAQLYSKVIGDFPKRFRTDWSELKHLLDGAERAIAPLSTKITGYRTALSRISEPPSLEDADSLLNAVKPVQEAIPAFRE